MDVSKRVTTTKLDTGTLLMRLKIPQNSFCRSWPIKTQNVISSLRPYLSIAKVPTSLSLFLLDAFHYCFFSTFWWFLVQSVKQLSKAYTKFHCKHVCAMSTRCIGIKMVRPPKFWKSLKTEPNFQYAIKWDTKIHEHHTCATLWSSYATVLMRSFFLTSVYIRWMLRKSVDMFGINRVK